MSEPHPEELIDRARDDRLQPEERRELEAHLRDCPSCAIELCVMRDFAAEAAPKAEDAAELERRVTAALQRIEREPARQNDHVRPKPVHARARRWAVLLAAAILLVAGLAVARFVRRRAPQPPSSPPMGPVVSVPQVELPPVVLTVSAPPASPTPALSSGPLAPPHANVSAAELFARANDARAHGHDAAAERLYGELERRYPGLPEAIGAHVALGRLLLDKMNDPAGALRQFDGYLAAGGPLREEALVGRALSLGALGHTAEERDAWRAVLAANPDSIHAARARERLDRLR